MFWDGVGNRWQEDLPVPAFCIRHVQICQNVEKRSVLSCSVGKATDLPLLQVGVLQARSGLVNVIRLAVK